jgi:hypothetical protein
MLHNFLSGGCMAVFMAIGWFFLRFWSETRDRFYVWFAVAFWFLALERIMLLIVRPENELRPGVYVIRLAAFVLITMAVYDKNRRP